MIIVAFSNKTHKKTVRICCRHFCHVAPIVIQGGHMVLYQFVQRGNITKINLRPRDLNILMQYGWVFVPLPGGAVQNFDKMRARTCVQMTKNAIGMRKHFVQTPWALFQRLKALEL